MRRRIEEKKERKTENNENEIRKGVRKNGKRWRR